MEEEVVMEVEVGVMVVVAMAEAGVEGHQQEEQITESL